jgi:hypothetical protein
VRKTTSLYDIINEGKLTKVKHKRKWLDPIPIGHHLVINVYQSGILLDTLFVDNIDICGAYTMIHYNPRVMEVYPVKVENTIVSMNKVWVFYENNTEFEVIRIS